MKVIDQEKLCEYCKNNMNKNPDTCEGAYCEEAKDQYMEDKGIIQGDKTFGELCIDDMLYSIATKFREIGIEDEGILQFNASGARVQIIIHGTSFFVDRKETAINNEGTWYFTNMPEAQAKLKELCIKRLIEISLVLGTIKEK